VCGSVDPRADGPSRGRPCSLVTSYHLRGNLITDAQLAALAIEHGLTLCSADTDFARFGEITWHNPLTT
jgi:predicted nucleic acid-binding protein